MVESRLFARLQALGVKNFREYAELLFSPLGKAEEQQLINQLTTHETWFFREQDHLEYLVKKALPELIARQGAGVKRALNVWSAGCSTGEEPYTLAMVFNEFSRTYANMLFNYFVLATDICTDSLATGRLGVYKYEKVTSIPLDLRYRYLSRNKNSKLRMVRILPKVRNKVNFRYLNLMDGDFAVREQMDIIFIRNVIIYFKAEVQEHIIRRLCNHILPGGYLFLGGSETLRHLGTNMEFMAPSIFRKPNSEDSHCEKFK